jgi:hypothetical protein
MILTADFDRSVLRHRSEIQNGYGCLWAIQFSMRGCPERNGVVHSIQSVDKFHWFFSNFSWPFKRDKSRINLLNIWLQLFIFSGYLIHVIDEVVFSSAKTHLPTDNLIVAIGLPRTFMKPWASGQPISESLLSLLPQPDLTTT